MVDATTWTRRNRQYNFLSLNFSCGGVISSWVLTRSPKRNVLVGDTIALQLWREEAGSESTYTLRTEQTHSATARNAASYAFTASPPMTVASGDVFGFYAPSSTGIRMAAIEVPLHTVFSLFTSTRPTEFTVRGSRLSISPLISVEFSKYMHSTRCYFPI